MPSQTVVGFADGHAQRYIQQIILIELSGGETTSVIVSNAVAVKLLFTVPQGKNQSATITITEGDGKDNADAFTPE